MGDRYNQACAVLSQLGAYSCYDGFSQAAYAAAICAKEPERLHSLIVRVYMETAAHYGTSWMAVEQNISQIGGMLWANNRAGVDALFGFSMGQEPTAALLVAALASALGRKSTPGGKGGNANAESARV